MTAALVLSTLLFTSFVGDMNTNGIIETDEMQAFAGCMGQISEFCFQFDADMDNDVDLFDYYVFQSTFGLDFNNNLIVQKAKEQGWDMTSNNCVYLHADPTTWRYYPVATYSFPPNQVNQWNGSDAGRVTFYMNDELTVKLFWHYHIPGSGDIKWATGVIEQYVYCPDGNLDLNGYCPGGNVGSNGYRLLIEENNLCATINGESRCGNSLMWVFDRFPRAEIISQYQIDSMSEVCLPDVNEMQMDAAAAAPLVQPAKMCLCIGNQAGNCTSNQCDANAGCGHGTCTWYEPPDMSCGGFAVWTMVIPVLHMFFMKNRLRRRYHLEK